LSFGGQRIVEERGCSEEEATKILNRALDAGIRYFATACMYSGGQARDQGLARYLSISGHTNPQVQVAALDRFPFDSVLCAFSALDHFILSFAEEFLPVANAKGVAVIAMKVLSFGSLVRHYENALRYTFGLPISTAIVGVDESSS
jgi:aryl-alcohol dehydrogenase-like predicted oxidoreductase